MRNFTTEDFSGGGQYLIRNDLPPGKYSNTGFMSTITYKVGWITSNERVFKDCPERGNIYTMTSMADGMTNLGYFDTRNDPEHGKNPRRIANANIYTWIWNQFNSLQILCDYLNNPKLCEQEYRFATQEEVVRVVIYQSSRWRN